MMIFLKKNAHQLGPHCVSLGMEYDAISETGSIVCEVKFVRVKPYFTGSWWATAHGRTAFGNTRTSAVEKLLASL